MSRIFMMVALMAFPAFAFASATEQMKQTGNPAAGAAMYEACAPCHGLNGQGIAGKTEPQLMAIMQNYQSGTFTAPKQVRMQKAIKSLSPQQMLDLAAYINKM